MATVAKRERSPLARWAFYWANRVPYWTMRTINGFIGRVTEDHRFHPTSRFPWVPAMEAMYPEAQREIAKLVRHMRHVPTVHEIVPTTDFYYSERDWKQLVFHCYGHRVEDHCALYPTIDSVLRKVPGLVTGTISILEPGEDIPAHQHVYKGLLIFHWGLVIPGETKDDCAIRVDGEIQRWEEGKVLVIDPCYSHDVWNRTDSRRIILLGEFRRPDMPWVLRFLDQVYLSIFNLSPIGKTMLQTARCVAARHRADVEGMDATHAPVA